jgi:hypothetical protein
MTKVAKFVKDLDEFTGHAVLYHLNDPLLQEIYNWDNDETTYVPHEYVIVSTATVPFSGPETYIFPANEQGEVVDWGELNGSRRGSYSHAEVLGGVGYEVVE